MPVFPYSGCTPDNLGLGASFARRFSLDIAVDLGKTTRQMVASAFYRF